MSQRNERTFGRRVQSTPRQAVNGNKKPPSRALRRPHVDLPILAALAVGLASCAGDLEDPEQFEELRENANGAIRPANEDPRPDSADDDDVPGPDEPGPDDEVLPASCNGQHPATIFGTTGKCGSAACHGSPGTAPVLAIDLGDDTTNLAERLVNADPVGSLCADSGLKILDPAMPEQSLLITKLSDVPPCGDAMPLTGFMITDDERQCIMDWALAQAMAFAP